MQVGVPGLLRGLIVCPFSMCRPWANLARDLGYDVIELFSVPTREAIEVLRPATGRPTIAIVNFARLRFDAATKGAQMLSLADVLIFWKPEGLIIDESHNIVSPSAKWARGVRNIAWSTPWVRCLSGTPTPNHFGNLWGQLSALDPIEWGYYYAPFRNRWLVCDAMYTDKVIGYRDLPLLRDKALSYCSVVRREDVFGPDEWVVNTREIDLPEAAERLYDRLAREWLIEDPDERLVVDGSHILTRLVRLQQIASGYIVGDDNVERPVHTAKIDAVIGDLDEIIESGEKSIIFHKFTWEGRTLLEAIRKRYPRVPVMSFSGTTTSVERERVTDTIENHVGSAIAVVQTQAGGVGISFAKSAYAQIMTQGFSFVAERQARDRIYTPATPRHLMYYRVNGTVDETIADALQAKTNLHEAVMNIDRRELAFGKKKSRLSV